MIQECSMMVYIDDCDKKIIEVGINTRDLWRLAGVLEVWEDKSVVDLSISCFNKFHIQTICREGCRTIYRRSLEMESFIKITWY